MTFEDVKKGVEEAAAQMQAISGSELPAGVCLRYCGAYGPRSNGAAQPAQRIFSGLGATTAVHELAVIGVR